MFGKKAEFGPDPANEKSVVLWSWLEGVSIWSAAMVPVPAQRASDVLLDALAPLSFGPLLADDGSTPHIFTNLPAYEARSPDFVYAEAGWKLTVVALESADHTRSVLLWWIVGSAHHTGDEMLRFDTRFRQEQVPQRLRRLGAKLCVVVHNRIADNTADVFAAYEQKDRLRALLRKHELGRQIATYAVSPISR